MNSVVIPDKPSVARRDPGPTAQNTSVWHFLTGGSRVSLSLARDDNSVFRTDLAICDSPALVGRNASRCGQGEGSAACCTASG